MKTPVGAHSRNGRPHFRHGRFRPRGRNRPLSSRRFEFWESRCPPGAAAAFAEGGPQLSEFLDSLAELFQQAGAGYFVLERLLTGLLAEAAAVTKLPGPRQMFDKDLARVTGGDYRRLPEIAGKIAEAGGGPGGKRPGEEEGNGANYSPMRFAWKIQRGVGGVEEVKIWL